MRIDLLAKALEAYLTRCDLSWPDAEVSLLSCVACDAPEALCCLASPAPVRNLLCASAPDAPCNLLLLREDVPMEDVLRAAQSALLEEQRYRRRADALVDAYLDDDSLSALLERAAPLFGATLLATDPNYLYKAAAFDREDSPLARSGKLPTVLTRSLEQAEPDGQGLIRLEAVNGQPAVLALRMKDQALSWLLALGETFSPSDVLLFLLLRRLALQSQLRRGSENGREDLDFYFLAELLDGERPAAEHLKRSPRALFWPLGAYMMVVADTTRHDLDARRTRTLDWRLGDEASVAMRTFRNGLLVLLVTLRPGTETALLPLLQARVQENGLVAGVSNGFTDLANIRTAYDQARRALVFGLQLQQEGEWFPLCLHRDYAFMALLEACQQREELLDFCDPALLSLMQYDQAHDNELVDTLATFLETGCNTQRTAELLFLHKNTVHYRLARIRKLLGCELSDSRDRFRLRVSFRILTFLNKYRPPKSVRF